MKKTLLLLIGLSFLYSCKKETVPTNTEDAQETTPNTEATPSTDASFSIENYPISTADLGEFPFFTAPEGSKYINNVKVKDFDANVVVTENDIFEIEGKVFRAWIHQDSNSDKEISNRYIIKSYEDAIEKLGGVKVFEGSLANDRLQQYNDLVSYKGSDGTFIPSGDTKICTYVIPHANGNVYITLEKRDYPTSSIQIVQEKGLTQTIKKITADAIANDLNETGKAVLYINFDTNAAVITNEGKPIVNEIAAALQANPSLHITIEGHTDNTGDAAQNKILSEKRAQAVVKQLEQQGIAKNRLEARGFGSEKPLVANDSEENKAKNRRVELIKK